MQIGTRLGHYDITGRLGAGGMGEVYRARDPSLRRDVALKIVSEGLARDPAALARLRREAQSLAAVTHPHIATLYSFAEDDGHHYLTMELVEGTTLGERLASGPLPLERSLQIAAQTAAALEAAHDRGVVHRDLKPSNIMLTEGGSVKVLDFGLARPVSEDEEPLLSHTPTEAGPLTGEETVLGTVPYMSPEQVRGKKADRRADVWGLGCVLYEMLSGQRAFGGESRADTVAAILGEEPDWPSLPADTPRELQDLMRRCLRKDLAQRQRDVGDVRLQLDDLQKRVARPEAGDGAAARPKRSLAALLVAAGAGAVLGGAFVFWMTRQAERAPRLVQMSIPLPAGEQVISPQGLAPPLAVSPDGRRIVYVSRGEAGSRLYLRDLDSRDVHPIAGSEDADAPFFAPDGRSIGFHGKGGAITTVSLSGAAAPSPLCTELAVRGGAWGADGTIVFAEFGGGLVKVKAEGGECEPLTHPDPARGEIHHRWPQFLPDGRTVLFTVHQEGEDIVALLDVASGTWKHAIPGGVGSRYVASGHVVFSRQQNLYAVPFDLKRKEVKGPPVVVREGVFSSPLGNAHFAVSDAGVLAYVASGEEAVARTLVWVDEEGRPTPIASGHAYEFPRISPDGTRVAAAVHTPAGTHDIWLVDLRRGTQRRLTSDGNYVQPIWTPDGRRVTFSSIGPGGADLAWVPADGSEPVELILERPGLQFPYSWHADEETLAFLELDPAGSYDIWTLGGGSVTKIMGRRFVEIAPAFSPDGTWLAYVSNETGRNEVYVRPFPGAGGAHQVSVDGGTEPVWSRDGQTLYYRRNWQLWSVGVSTGTNLELAEPKLLFKRRYEAMTAVDRSFYDVASDGRLLMVQSGRGSQATRVEVVLGWFEDLERRLAAD